MRHLVTVVVDADDNVEPLEVQEWVSAVVMAGLQCGQDARYFGRMRATSVTVEDAPNLPKIRRITQTGHGCPTAWRGYLEDERSFSIRYRHGTLTARISEKYSSDGGEVVYQADHGDSMGGVIDYDDMVRKVRIALDFSDAEWFTEED